MRRRRAIIFDEEPVILLLLESIFSKRGYEVMTFKEPVICPVYENNQDNGTCIKDYACADIIISNQRLPTMGGIEFLQKQATHGCKLTSANKAIIAPYLSEDDMQDLRELGAFFISTPFHLVDLIKWVEECEERRDISIPIAIRRREKRMSVQVPVSYCAEATGTVMDGTVTDISRSGFCLSTKRAFDPEEVVRLISELPYTCSVASARWSKKQDGEVVTGFSCV